MPAPGWTFLQWLGDVSGTNATNSLRMSRDQYVEAVFGTTLRTTTSGNGSVIIDPAAGVYPYGYTVTLTALPQTGSGFSLWGNAASGTNNPLRISITNANPAVSCLFAPLNAAEVTLTLIENGHGQVMVKPSAARCVTGQAVALMALAEPEEQFLGWSGDASGTATNLVVTLDRSKVITAIFTRSVRLVAWPWVVHASEDEFRFRFSGDLGRAYELQQSTDLISWQSVGFLTNVFGAVQYGDPFQDTAPQRFYRLVILP